MINFALPIPNFPDYLIDVNGNIWDKNTNKLISLTKDEIGYLYVKLRKDNKVYSRSHHRLYMETFYPIENMDELHVNHINGIKDNNIPENLEWCTNQENVWHAGKMGLTTRCIPTDIFNVYTGDERSFNSGLEAGNYVGISADSVIYRTKQSNDIVWEGGWRFKRFDDVWIEMTDIENVLINYNSSKYIDIKNLLTGFERRCSSQTEAANYLNLTPSVISVQVNTGQQRILPGMWVVKRVNEDWIHIPDMWLKYEQDNQERPIICYYPDGTTCIFESITTCGNAIGIGKTTIFYRLNNRPIERGRNGYGFEYYSEYVRRLGN